MNRRVSCNSTTYMTSDWGRLGNLPDSHLLYQCSRLGVDCQHLAAACIKHYTLAVNETNQERDGRMKFSANLSAFIVLVAVILGLVLYVDSVDIETEVKTAEESRLPNVYTGEGQTAVAGFSFRYPRGWEVVGSESGIRLRRPINFLDRESGNYDVRMTIEDNNAESLAELLPEVPDADVREVTYAGLPAIEISQAANDNVNFLSLVQLNEDNLILRVENSEPIAEGDWDELQEEIDTILNSIVADDVRAIAPPLTVAQLPVGWAENPGPDTSITATKTDETGAPQAAVFVGVRQPQEMLDDIHSISADLTGSDPITDIENPVDLLEAYFSDFGSEDVSLLLEPAEADYFGLSGKEVGVSLAGQGELRIAALDAEDGFYVLVLQQVLVEGGFDTLGDEIVTVLESIEYNTPDPIYLETGE